MAHACRIKPAECCIERLFNIKNKRSDKIKCPYLRGFLVSGVPALRGFTVQDMVQTNIQRSFKCYCITYCAAGNLRGIKLSRIKGKT